MVLRHCAVTQKQFNETWNLLPDGKRYWATNELWYKAGYPCYELDGLLIWVDQFLPEDQIDERVEKAVQNLDSGGK